MDKEEKTTEPTVAAEEAPPKTKRDEFAEYMRGRLGETSKEYDDEGFAEASLDYIRKGDEASERLAQAVEKDPQLAQAMSDLLSGKRSGAAALRRYFGDAPEEGADGYDEWESSEAERLSELEAQKANADQYAANIENSKAVIDDFAAKRSLNAEDFFDEVYETLLVPIFNGEYTAELCDRLYKAMNYDTDVEESFAAGEVKGRNEKIDKMKTNLGDGLPRMKGVASPPKETKKKSTPNDNVWNR